MNRKHNLPLIVFAAIVLVASCATGTKAGKNNMDARIIATLQPESEERSLHIAGYDFELPEWWYDVSVNVPQDLYSEKEIREHVWYMYGGDAGTKKTWKHALKLWALAAKRNGIFPVYIGHCFKTGEDFKGAAKVFSELYFLADSQGKDKDWYRVYLAYNAGESYYSLADYANAKSWYSKAAEYAGSLDSAIGYYAKESAKRVKSIKK